MDARETKPIVLTTVNARYSHTAFGLRWLWANLGRLQSSAEIVEFHLGQSPVEIAERLLERNPVLIGFGVYVWNVTVVTQVVEVIKGVRPDVLVVLGGPEVSFEYEGTALFDAADYLIRGEGEEAFAQLAGAVIERGDRPAEKVITPAPPDVAALALPYEAYTDEDIAHRLIYVEASRGCPFHCEFCLSALDDGVREFPLEPFLEAMGRLIERGALHFKFVDRTFNLRHDRVAALLAFFQERWRPGMQLHFEILPDRLSDAMLALMAEVPPEGLHLEVGVQTFCEEAQAAVSRRQDMARTEEVLRYLRERTGAIVHADLVVGLPGETWESFAAGFDRLLATRPHKIQVGILKRLKGAPISRHIVPHAMVFATHPPYEILQTDTIDFGQMQRLRRFARYFDLFHNAGNFPASLEILWDTVPSAFDAFMALSDYIWQATGRTHRLALATLAEQLHAHLVAVCPAERAHITDAIESDFHRVPGRKDRLSLS